MAITVRPMTRADLPVAATIGDRAFYNDELFTLLYPRYAEFPSELREYWLVRLKHRLIEPTNVCFVAEDVTKDEKGVERREMVGTAIFARLGKGEGGEIMRAADTLWNKIERALVYLNYRYVIFFDHTDREVSKRFDTDFDSLNKLDEDPNGYWYLVNIAVSPDHQRKGIGSRMLARGMELASNEGLPMALNASVVGRHLYQKNGFRILEKKKTVEGLDDSVVMIWEPDKQET